MSDFTSLHEFGHVWIMHAKANETELYGELTNLVKDSPYYATVKETYATYYTADSEFIDEAIALAIEDSGKKFLNKLERKTFIEKVMALFQNIYKALKPNTLEKETLSIVERMFNAKTPISKNNLAELDFLQFSKEEFDKNSYFIRHVIQKISEDELFLKMANKAKTSSEQEFIFQIINSMIKNTVPSKALSSTVESYTQGFSDYLNLVQKDAFTEQYIQSEVAKLEASHILRSMLTDATKNQSELGKLLKEGIPTDKVFINQLDDAIIKMSKSLGLKRIF